MKEFDNLPDADKRKITDGFIESLFSSFHAMGKEEKQEVDAALTEAVIAGRQEVERGRIMVEEASNALAVGKLQLAKLESLLCKISGVE
jgi:hypothetical protein